MTDDFTPKTIRQLPALPAALDGTELLEVERLDRSYHASIADLVPLLPAGPSAYQVAVEEGFEGTEAEWLESLRGPMGDVTPEALAARDEAVEAADTAGGASTAAIAARDAAQEAASAAAQSAADAAAAFPGLDARVTELEENPAFPDAPDDGGAYIRVNGQWVQLYAPLALAGDLPDGTVNEPYSAALTASGGRPPYTLGDVLLPPGLDATLSDATVTVAGTPSEEWEAEAHIDLSDSLGTATRRTLDVRIDPVPAPAIDLFVIVGQSNAEGRGDSTLSPAAPNGRFWDGSGLVALADPVGGAITGSMWPSFSNEWFSRTGRMSAFVEAAHGGTALLPDQAGTNWSPSGTLRGNAVALANAAFAGISGSGSYSLGNVYFVWSQGESDAENGVSEADYESALEEIAAYFKAQVPQMATMGVIQTGFNRNLPGTIAGFAAIRKAQDDACADSPNLTMLYRGAHSFWAANPMLMKDSLHYNQHGLNLAGRCAALALATDPQPAPPAPAIIGSNAYPDPTYSSKIGRNAPHTTSAGTRCVLVAVAAMRNDAPTVLTITGVSFSGIAMREVGSVSGAGGGALGYARVSLYAIDEEAFGGPLSGVTGEVSVTIAGGSTTRMIDWCAIDCDRATVADHFNWFNPVPANVSSASTTSTSNFSGLWLTIGASCSAGPSPLNATLTGATEIMDHGLANAAATRVGQMVVGHSTQPITVNRSVTVGWGANCEAVAIATFVMRGKVAGE